MPAVYSHFYDVTPDEIDGFGHVNNLNYIKWLLTAAVAHSTAQGWPPERYHTIGAGWVVRSHHIEYLQPAFVGETLEIRTWVAGFSKVTSLRKYKVFRPRDGALLIKAETNWAYLGMNPYAPRRIPAELLDAFTLVPADQEP